MQKRDGQVEAEAHTESGEEEAKGGEEMTKGEEMTREEVVQAALIVERWCDTHTQEKGHCDCPFSNGGACVFSRGEEPSMWYLEEFLRTRGLEHD